MLGKHYMPFHTNTIAIQGELGSNHHIICKKLFPRIPCNVFCATSFPKVFSAIQNCEVDLAIIAIENTIAGSIVGNYDLLSVSSTHVISEAYLHVHHCLIGLPGTTLNQVHVVYSHEMALKQCGEFLAKHNIEAREFYDTAGAIPHVQKLNDPSIVAIAPEQAAQLHNMVVIQKDIETNHHNYTRFLVITSKKSASLEINSIQSPKQKVMIEFELEHKPGTLAKVLALLASYHCNLTKIESRPIIAKLWEYKFYLEFIIDVRLYTPKKIIQDLQRCTHQLHIFGIFTPGRKFEP